MQHLYLVSPFSVVTFSMLLSRTDLSCPARKTNINDMLFYTTLLFLDMITGSMLIISIPFVKTFTTISTVILETALKVDVFQMIHNMLAL